MNEQQERVTLPVEGTVPPSLGTTSVPEEKICCTRCAAEIPDVDAVCPVCGFAWHETRKQKIASYFRIYVICLIANLILGILPSFFQNNFLMSAVFSVLTIPFSIVGLVYSMMFLYQCWSLIPKKNRRAWPGQYVGFLFVPFYNLYWAFPAYYGLVKRQNELLPEGKRGSSKIVLTFLILPYASCLLVFLGMAILAIAGFMNSDGISVLTRYHAVQVFLTGIFSVLITVYGYLAYLELKNGACSLFELPAEERKRIMMSLPCAPGAKKTALWPVWTFGGGCSGCFTLIFILMIIGVIFAHGLNNERNANMRCRNNLKQIGLALKMYEDDNKGQYPADCGAKGLGVLAGKHYIPEQALVCPSSAKSSGQKDSTYIYLGGLNSETAPDMIFVVCKGSGNKDKDTRFNVLFADGTVQEVILPGKAGYAELFRKYGILDDRNGFTEKGKQLPPETRNYISDLLRK